MENVLDKKLVIFFLLLPFLEPRGVGDMAIYLGGIWFYADELFTAAKLLSLLLILLLSASALRRASAMLVCICLYQAIVLLVSLLNGTLVRSTVTAAASVVGLCILTDIYMRRSSALLYLMTISRILFVFICINFVTVLLFPDGMYTNNRGWDANYFFGYKNSHVYVYLVFLLVTALCQMAYCGRLKRSFYVLLFLFAVSARLTDSSTSFVSMILVSALFLCFGLVRLPRWATVAAAFGASMLASYLLVFLHVQDYFEAFIARVLRRSHGTGRNAIWERCIEYVQKKPLFGNGTIQFDDLYKTWTVTQAHNEFLDVLLVGGGLLLLVFALLFLMASRRLNAIRGTPLYNPVLFIWVGYFVEFLTEAYRGNAYMFMCLIITSYIGQLINSGMLEKENAPYRKRYRIVFKGRQLI